VQPQIRVAAAASVPAALLAHALDASGRLPFVHESGDVRGAMGPLAVVLWLGLTALVVGLAAASRWPAVVGAPASLASAGLPELIGRHDAGAVFEPGAMLGAVVQWLLLLVVVGLAVVASRVLRLTPLVAAGPLVRVVAARPGRSKAPYVAPRWRLRSRAPPRRPSHRPFLVVQEGHPCTHPCAGSRR
jgi:hypothetical protein